MKSILIYKLLYSASIFPHFCRLPQFKKNGFEIMKIGQRLPYFTLPFSKYSRRHAPGPPYDEAAYSRLHQE